MPRTNRYAARYARKNCGGSNDAADDARRPGRRRRRRGHRAGARASLLLGRGRGRVVVLTRGSASCSRAHLVGQLARREVLAQLQGADVGGDGPAVARRDLLLVVGHRAVAVGDHVEEVADGRRCAAGRCGTTAAACSRARRSCRGRCRAGRGRRRSRSCSGSGRARGPRRVTGKGNVSTRSPSSAPARGQAAERPCPARAPTQRRRRGPRLSRPRRAVPVNRCQVGAQVAARHGAGDQRPGRPAVGEERAGLVRADAGLVRPSPAGTPAASSEQQAAGSAVRRLMISVPPAPQCSTSGLRPDCDARQADCAARHLNAAPP